jgi:hypothetical protein
MDEESSLVSFLDKITELQNLEGQQLALLAAGLCASTKLMF